MQKLPARPSYSGSLVCLQPLVFSLAILASAFWSPVGAQTATPSAAAAYTEISRKQVNHGDHTETYVLVKPPQLAKAPPLPSPAALTADEQAVVARRANKTYESLTLIGTVYLGNNTITELTWTTDDGKQHRAFSNVDFRVFTQMTDIETNTAVIQWFPMITASDGAPDSTLHGAALKQLNGKGVQANYIVEGESLSSATLGAAFDALDYLHAYYQANRAALISAYQKRMTDDAARELQAQNAPKPSPTIYFWPIQPKKP